MLRTPMALSLLLALGACSPTFDWRESRPDPALLIHFPCRPKSLTRDVQMAGQAAAMQLTSCSAGGLTFGLGRIDAGDASRVEPLMQATRDALTANLSAASAEATGSADVKGAAVHPQSQRFRVEGVTPDGARLRAHAVVFAHEGVVYQATVVGAAPASEIVETFFDSIRLTR